MMGSKDEGSDVTYNIVTALATGRGWQAKRPQACSFRSLWYSLPAPFFPSRRALALCPLWLLLLLDTAIPANHRSYLRLLFDARRSITPLSQNNVDLISTNLSDPRFFFDRENTYLFPGRNFPFLHYVVAILRKKKYVHSLSIHAWSNPATSCTRSDKSPGCKSIRQALGTHGSSNSATSVRGPLATCTRAKNKMPYMRPATVRSLRGPKENARTALTSSRVFRDYGIGKDSYDRGQHG